MATRIPGGRSAAARLRRVAGAAHVERLVTRAVAQGLLTQGQADEARAVAGEDAPALLALLDARGWLPRETVARLEADEAREIFARPQVAPMPPEVAHAAALPGRTLGSFVLTSLLGQGGTGEVWKAWDQRLGRWVALKLATVALGSTSGRERFAREAVATARLTHPHIVAVFQVGTEHGRAFLVMPFVDGDTLERLSLPVRRALQVGQTVALAVEHAHQHGIVHRDLKPGNVMIDRDGGVWVLDFGLAYLREETSSRLTRPGEVIGTASFMAPEQARGDREASGTCVDVYGLGATLYALCTGRAPYVGDSFAAVVAQVVRGEPTAPRKLRPQLDPRIEAVILKAMALDPRQRYASAAALADDLGRILDDGKVVARRPSPLARLRRRPLLVAAVLLGIGALAALGQARLGADRERAASLATLRELARLSLDTALRLRRAGDTAGMRQLMPRLLATYEAVRARDPASAEAEYLVGRMYRALLDEKRALDHQERALARDPGFVPALYERAVLVSGQYGRARGQAISELRAEGVPTPASPEAVERARPALAALRAQVLRDCMRLQSVPLAAANADAAQGILAYHERKLDEARVRLERAVAADPFMEEAWETLARTETAADRRNAAERVYQRAIAIDRGYAPHHVGRCELRRWYRQKDAIADATAALVFDPSSSRALLCRGHANTEQSHDLLQRGLDATEQLAAADRDLGEAHRISPSAGALWMRGTVRRYRGIQRVRRGGDPMADFDASEADFSAAIAMEPRRADLWSGRGRVRARRAVTLLDRGTDPLPALSAAEADYDQAERVDPVGEPSWLWRGDAVAHRGAWSQRNGAMAEALERFQIADAHFARAIAERDDGWGPLLRGTMRTWHGNALATTGKDPTAVWAGAEQDLAEAARRLPRYIDVRLRAGELTLARAGWSRGAQRRGALAAARADFQAVLGVEPEHVQARAALARLDR